MSVILDVEGSNAAATASRPGLEPGPMPAALAFKGAAAGVSYPDPSTQWVPALRPGHGGGASCASSCPGLEPGPISAALGVKCAAVGASYPSTSRSWVPALRPGHGGGASCASHLADLAVSALVAEAALTPKPGLVDARGPGAHADVELDDFLASAEALHPTFAAMARAAEVRRPSRALRETLARIGREGEAAMASVTRGANTHRGAIFALGLIVAGAAIEGEGASPEAICATAGAISRFPDRFAPETELNGARACRAYGVTGARGEAAAGFPHAREALSALRTARAGGASETAARLDALIAVMARLDDTCLLHRGGVRALRVARLGARAVAAAGGAGTAEGMAALIALDRRLLALNASPGGSADMLAAALFLDDLACHPGRREAPSRDRFQDETRHGPARPDHPRHTSSAAPTMGPPVKPEDDEEVLALDSEDDPGSALRAVRDDGPAAGGKEA